MLIDVTLGQDTACYWSGSVDLPAETVANAEALRLALLEWANQQLDPDQDNFFEPEYDFMNPRIVCATVDKGETAKRETLAEDLPLGPRYHDGGLLLGSAILQKSLSNFLEAADECGKSRRQALEFLAAVAEEAQCLLLEESLLTDGYLNLKDA